MMHYEAQCPQEADAAAQGRPYYILLVYSRLVLCFLAHTSSTTQNLLHALTINNSSG